MKSPAEFINSAVNTPLAPPRTIKSWISGAKANRFTSSMPELDPDQLRALAEAYDGYAHGLDPTSEHFKACKKLFLERREAMYYSKVPPANRTPEFRIEFNRTLMLHCRDYLKKNRPI
jgi:hypothetical protein